MAEELLFVVLSVAVTGRGAEHDMGLGSWPEGLGTVTVFLTDHLWKVSRSLKWWTFYSI